MKKIMITTITAFILQLSGFCQSGFDPGWATRFQEVLDSVRLAENVMGVAAAVYTPDQGIWTGISGNSIPGQLLTPDMRLGIGSNTKLFIAVTMMKLQEANVLSLDDHLYQWLPTFPYIDSSITIRQLLNHQSGIRSFTDNPDFWATVLGDTSHLWTLPEILGYVWPPYFEPGTAWRYSNTNYILAGMIINSSPFVT